MRVKIKKTIAIFLTVSMILLYSVPKPYAFADDTSSPSPSPSSSPSTTVDNSATVSNSASTNSNTGDNSVSSSPSPTPSVTPDPSNSPSPSPDVSSSPSPTPDPSSSPSPSPDPSPGINASNSATVTNNSSSTTISGDNTINATGSGQTATDSASTNTGSTTQTTSTSINTGNAVSTTATDNTVNTTSVNSQVVYQTINIFVTQNGDINLSDPFTIAANAVTDYPSESVINVSATTVNNYAYLSNDLVSYANTGNNQINGATESAVINTGNAYSIVSLVNKVNFTVVNSEIHVITINLFGKLNGNIILPDMSQSQNCASCGVNLNVNNNANVTNNIDSTAVTGQNSATGSASITTGNAGSAVNTLNLVNTNLVGVNARVLYINDYGTWNGNFIGWGKMDPQAGGATLVFYSLGPNSSSCASCSAQTNVNNNATVVNNISSFSNTGGNSILGNGFIYTGNAYSSISLINFINSTFINSIGFFGFINIFGDWTGNIGGNSEFAALNQQTNNNTQTVSSGSQAMESGGMLAVKQINNTGSFVKPGDTVTFFIDSKNVGTGTVYGAKLELYLMRNGVPAGGVSYDLGDIPAGQGVKVSTGIVLSPNTPSGIYTARALVYGKVGPNAATVTAYADSYFTVLGAGFVNNALFSQNNTPPKNNQEVLGAHYPLAIRNNSNNDDYGPLYALATVIMAYIALRSIRQKDKFITIFGKRVSLEERMQALKMFLL